MRARLSRVNRTTDRCPSMTHRLQARLGSTSTSTSTSYQDGHVPPIHQTKTKTPPLPISFYTDIALHWLRLQTFAFQSPNNRVIFDGDGSALIVAVFVPSDTTSLPFLAFFAFTFVAFCLLRRMIFPFNVSWSVLRRRCWTVLQRRNCRPGLIAPSVLLPLGE